MVVDERYRVNKYAYPGGITHCTTAFSVFLLNDTKGQ